MHKVLIIDGNSIFFRAYFATAIFPEKMLRTKDGFPTNAIYGFNKMIHAAVDKIRPTHLFIAFDKSSKTKRKEQYNDYKSKRSETPTDLIRQIPIVKELLTLQGIIWYEHDDWEADDIVASLASLEASKGNEVIIISSDRDLLQLVSPNIKYMINKRGMSEMEEYNIENFYEKVNLYPTQIPDYKGLSGDASDNLPGVKGLGPKGAITLLHEYKTFDNIYASIDKLSETLRRKLNESKEIARLCFELAHLKMDLDIPFAESQYKLQIKDTPELALFYEKYELNSFLRKLESKPNSKYEKVIF